MQQNMSSGDKIVLDFYITINLVRFFKHFSLNECFVLKLRLHKMPWSEPILDLSDLKLLANIISRQQKLPLAWKELERLVLVFVAEQAVVHHILYGICDR